MILFLDFDGALHDEDIWYIPGKGIYIKTPGWQLFEWEPIWVELLAPHPNVQIGEDVIRHQPSDWFAIDNDGDGDSWPAWCRDRLVHALDSTGLRDPAVQKDIRRRLDAWVQNQS
jgi:hypothetical protein